MLRLSVPSMPLDLETQRLLKRTLETHKAAAKAVCDKEAAKARPSPAAAPRLKAAKAPLGRRAPSAAERANFLSSDPSRIYAAPRALGAPSAAARPDDGGGGGGELDLELRNLSKAVEALGSTRLEGLAKKDHAARQRKQLALKPAKEQKRPYTQLVALRKKQRSQDHAAAELAREAGNTARRSTIGGGELGVAPQLKRRKPAGLLDADARDGVMHVSRQTIRKVQFQSRVAARGCRGGGKGGGRGGQRSGANSAATQ